MASSRAGSLPHLILGVYTFCVRHRSPVGVGLARDGGVSAASMVADMTSSRASPPPQVLQRLLDPEPIPQRVVRGTHGGERGLEGAAADHGHVR